MNRIDFERIERDARSRRARQLRGLVALAVQALVRYLVPQPTRRGHVESHPDVSPAERFVGLARFQDRLKNSRPPRIAVMRSISRSRCSGTSTKFRRSLLTISSGLSE